MKARALVLLVALISANQALACIGSGDFSICTGDTVYRGSNYTRGATVMGISLYRNTVTVRSIGNGEVFEESVTDLDVAKGCLGLVCVGKTVYKGGNYRLGAIVRGLNPNHQTATVQSIGNGSNFEEDTASLYISSGCLDGVCVGDTVYKGSNYSRGATVRGINFSAQSVTVQSISNGSLYEEDPRALDVSNMCTDYDDRARRHSFP